MLMSGVAGAYFKVMTNSMIITLVCSFFVTWLLLPVIYLLFSKKKRKNMGRFFYKAIIHQLYFYSYINCGSCFYFSKIANWFFAADG
jgi:multidrug efflux pump subunit AcrB